LGHYCLEFVNDWARSSPILDEFAEVHGFDHEHVQIVFRIVMILICVFFLVLFEMALRRTAAKIARDRSGLKIFERAWAQNSSIDERPYSLSVIRFSGGRWEYVGVGFDKNFALAAEGNTQSLFYNNSRREWVFGGPAWLRSQC
jgi:hypothetical protein